ncbi:MAG: signal peptidase II [Candidatus Aquicultor sp.]|nr:signal peptidase II [Candidatus Aquicultor sp.]
MFYIVATLIIVIDQITKAIVRSAMPIGESLPLIPGVLYLTHIANSGAAFGILQNNRVIFFVAAAVVISLIFCFQRSLGKDNRAMNFCLGLVMGGAIGNLIDRVTIGAVTDFIDFRFWPVFNVADSAIVIGAIFLGLIILSLAKEERVETGQP